MKTTVNLSTEKIGGIFIVEATKKQELAKVAGRRKVSGKVGKGISTLIRKAVFLTVSLILRWPIWVILVILRPLRLFDYLFLVYPGSDCDLDGYCPRWLAKSWIFSGKPTIGGIVTKGRAGVRGLVLVVPNTIQEFSASKPLCWFVLRRLERLNWLVGSRVIALAGMLPGVVERKQKVPFGSQFVRGIHGTVFCVMETVERARKKDVGTFQVAQIGVGHCGGALYNALYQDDHRVRGIDIRPTKKGVLLPEESRAVLEQADMVVVLTPRGSDFDPYTGWLKAGATVIDDTHPRITKKPDGVEFIKVAVGLNGVEFRPRLPGYRANWIPGCAVEAIVCASRGDCSDLNFNQFRKRAIDLGFFAHLDC